MLQIKTTLALITCALLILNNCGKRKPPLPPVERVRQEIALSGRQQGNTIILSWTMPLRNASENNIQNVSRIDIYRLVEPFSSPLSLTEDDFASQSTIIDSIQIEKDDFLKKDFTYQDKLVFAEQIVRIRYAIRFVNSAGQKAAFSNFLLIEPVNRIASNPESLTAKTSQEAVNLGWIKPTINIDGSSPANVLGYNVYRNETAANLTKKINSAPVNVESFSDRFFTFGNDYEYFVRTISIGSNGEPVESLNSNTVEINPKDIFPPTAPTAITVAASPGIISIFFAVNPETDVKGYQIFRSSDPELPKDQWQNLTAEILTANTFQDRNIESGKSYYYYLVAIDNFGNTSAPSDTVTETAP